MKENSALERLKNGIITENPTFVLTLGMCPTLAVTTSAVNGLGMGLTTMAVLALSNMFISMLLIRTVVTGKTYLYQLKRLFYIIRLCQKSFFKFCAGKV